ncbi:hypothetical protein Tco_1276364 [Tanacetum coccineum]
MGNRIRTRNSPDMLLGMILQFEFFEQKCVDEASECSYEFNTRLFQRKQLNTQLYMDQYAVSQTLGQGEGGGMVAVADGACTSAGTM